MKTLIIGFDGACWEYLDPLLNRNELPNLAALIKEGYRGVLESVMPPITPVAWSSIVTGVNAGKHGVYEWVREDTESGELLPVNSSDRKAEPFWNLLNEAGVRVGVVNVPLTHPPQPIDGFLLCGFSSPRSARDLSYPESILVEVENAFGPYIPDLKVRANGTSPQDVLTSETKFQSLKIKQASFLANLNDVEVLVINLMLLDHANHKLPDMEQVDQAARETDRQIGELIGDFEPNNTILISDHGSRRLEGVFLMGAWLVENGYLSWTRRSIWDKRRALHYLLGRERALGGSIIDRAQRWALSLVMAALPMSWMRSRWDALESNIPLAQLQATSTGDVERSSSVLRPTGARRGNVRLDLNHSDSEGTEDSLRANRLLSRVADQLRSIIDPETGVPVFTDIRLSQNEYEGPLTQESPDLIGDYYSSRWGVAMKLPGLQPRKARYFLGNSDLSGWYGDHSTSGIFVAAGQDFRVGEAKKRFSILDVAPTLLYLYDVAIPEDYDGSPLMDAIPEHLANSRPLRNQRRDFWAQGPDKESRSGRNQEPSAERDQSELIRRLEDLGYVE